MGGEKREKNFSRNTRISRVINDGKNRLEKVRNNVFYKLLNIVTKNGGKKREKIFSRNTDFASKQRWKKIVLKKCENTIFKNTFIL